MKKFMAAMMSFMMLSCRRVTELSCTEEDRSFFDGLRYKFHLFMCHKCKEYAEQIRVLREKVKQALQKEVDPEEVKKLEDSILKKLDV